MIWSEADWEKEGYVNGRKTSINLCSLERPHMRAFWFSAFAFFICFFMWFDIPPLMATLRKPKCEDPTGDICTACFTNFPDILGDAMAKDKGCKVCSPFNDGIGMGCG
ncbi:hypothetical protein T484DRAFT_1914167, partial [Baffinella frigidus]